jgi:hypothetical protein
MEKSKYRNMPLVGSSYHVAFFLSYPTFSRKDQADQLHENKLGKKKEWG